MAEQASLGLNYGQVGQFLYDTADKTWIARRAFGSPYALTPLTPSQWAVRPLDCDAVEADANAGADVGADSSVVAGARWGASADVPSSKNKPSALKPSRRVAAHLPTLMRQLPVTAPAASISAGLAHLSQDVTNVTARHDPIIGCLLAFGRVTDHLTRRTLAIAAFPDRKWPNILCLTQVQPQKQGWEHSKGIWIDVSRISGESTTWDAGQAIRQLCFSAPQSDETHAPSHYLAVRTSMSVHILRLSLGKRTISTRSSPSRFRITATHSLNIDILGGVPPADVVFNPFYDRQLATIDQNGTWRIWDLSRQPVGAQGRPLEIASGAAADQSVADAFLQGRVLDDGWGCVTWAQDTSTVIVASRKSLGVYHVTDKPVRLLSPDLAISGTPHWILDIQSHPRAYPAIFVLTSTHLVCLRTDSLYDLDPGDFDVVGAQTLWRTAHFRDPEDISLRLYTFMDENDIVVLIKSALSLVATSYRCTSIQTSASPFLSVSDPTIITLPEHPAKGQPSPSSLGLHIQPAAYGEGYGGPAGPGEIYQEHSVRFYQMTSITEDRSIVEKLYCGHSGDRIASNEPVEVLAPSWHGRLTYGASRVQKRPFVVDDDDEIVDGLDHDGLRLDQRPPHVASFKYPSSSSRRHKWTIAYEQTYNRINKQNANLGQEFADILDAIKDIPENPEKSSEDGGISTLYELFQAEVLVGDLDDATAQFHRLFLHQHANDDWSLHDKLADTSRSKPEKLASARALGLTSMNDTQEGLTATYDNIISHWLLPISKRVPGRVRLAKEQLARRIAAEICLASCGMKRPVPVQSQDWPTDVPDTPAERPASSQFMASSQPQSSFPTPSPTATPSLTTATSLSSHPSTMASAEYLRLQRYTTFSADRMAPGPLPRSLAKKLSHWTVGSSPDKYDWLATQRQQEKEAEEEDEDIGPKERARLKRRAEKHLRKQRRETSKAASMVMASSQAPEILSASQPAAVLQRRTIPTAAKAEAATQAVMSSSQPALSQVPQVSATQVEPGRFGGRPAPKKKKKRDLGF